MNATEIRDLRAGLGISQGELARRLGRSASTIYLWESGRRQPRGVSLRDLLAFADDRGRCLDATEIRDLRTRLGISRVELARRLGTTATTVYRWEAGLRRPTGLYRRDLLALAKDALPAREGP